LRCGIRRLPGKGSAGPGREKIAATSPLRFPGGVRCKFDRQIGAYDASMIRILASPDSAERLTAAADFVGSFSPAAERLVVGASREAVDHFARSVALPLKATFGLHRFTLTQLAAHLATADFARRGVAHGTLLAAEAVAARSVFEALERAGLDYFKPVARLPGFARTLASTIAELRLAGADAGSVAGLDGSGRDLGELLRVFEEQLQKGSVADRAGLFRTAAAALRAGGEERFAGWPMLFLDVPLHTAAERDFLQALFERSQDVLVTVQEGDARTLAMLAPVPGARRIAAAERQPETSPARLRRYLFSSQAPDRTTADREVCFFSAPGEGRECTEIARRVLDEAAGGVRFDQMVVLLRAPSAYTALLETALARAGIPAFFTRGSRRPDPSGRAFLAILACAAERLSANRFAEYLSLGQVPALDERGAPQQVPRPWVRADDEALGPPPGIPDEILEGEAGAAEPADSAADQEEAPALDGMLRAPWNWERLLVEAAVIGGQDRWTRRLDGLEKELRLKRNALSEEEPDSPRVRGVERDLKNLAHLRAFALPVIEKLAAWPAGARWNEWLEQLQDLAPLVLRRPERVLELLAELEPMERVGPVSLDEIHGVLAERLSTLEPERPRRGYGRIFVGTPEQARGRSFEIVFVPGLAERIFPQRVDEDPLLLDELRRQLGRELRLQSDRVAAERLQLRLAVAAARTRIYISYPRVEVAKARQRVPSFYALDVQRATRGRIPKFEELEAEARREGEAALDWPAPSDPNRAIDDMEHDLAVLGPLLRQSPDASTKGRARYLFELNPHLARSLRTRWARWQKPWSAADGLCKSRQAAEPLAAHRLTERPYSVSALQKFALCPYQFLLFAIHRLEPREEKVPLVEIDPLTRGSIFHRIQADFMRQLQQSGSLPVTLANLRPAQQCLDETLERVDQKYRDDLAPAIPQVWRESIERIRTDLRGWLQRMADSPSDWLPIHFEFGIGFPLEEGRDPASLEDPVRLPGGYQLHGFIDVIERRAGKAELRVTDYKTGANRTREGMVLGAGEVLQPVLYSLAVEAAKKEPVSEGRLYFCTSVGGFSERVVPLHEITRQRGVLVLETINRAVEQALLLPAPKERACSWCDFREVCGPREELRASRKDPEALDDLNVLRGLL
jgi:ATP-dependent helicase/nuclease subunit B